MGAKALSFTLALPMLVIAAIMMVKAEPDTTDIDTRCNPQEIRDAYSGNVADVYTKSLGVLLNDLVPDAAYAPGYKLYVRASAPPCNYGFAICRRSLSPQDCSTCLKAALFNVERCDGKVGAKSILFDCYLRYENYPFPEEG